MVLSWMLKMKGYVDQWTWFTGRQQALARESQLSYPKEGLTIVAASNISVVSVMEESWGDDTDKDKDSENDMEGKDAWFEISVLSAVLYGAK